MKDQQLRLSIFLSIMLKMCVLKHQMLNKIEFNQSIQQYFLFTESQLCLDRIKHRQKMQKI